MLYTPSPGSNTREAVGWGTGVGVSFGVSSEAIMTAVSVADGCTASFGGGAATDGTSHDEKTPTIPKSIRIAISFLVLLFMFNFGPLPQRLELINVEITQHHMILLRKSLHIPESIPEALVCLA